MLSSTELFNLVSYALFKLAVLMNKKEEVCELLINIRIMQRKTHKKSIFLKQTF